MAARKSYKTLYMQAMARLQEVELDYTNTKQRLSEIEWALVPYGHAQLKAIPDGDGAISLDPLGFVAARAFMESHQRITYESGGYSQLYTWRGRPLLATEGW